MTTIQDSVGMTIPIKRRETALVVSTEFLLSDHERKF